MQYDAQGIADIMGGRSVLGRDVRSLGDLSAQVERGLPKEALRAVARAIFSEPKRQMKLIYTVIPEATYKRRRDRLTTEESERTERLARVAAIAREAWGDDAQEFLTTAHPLLRGRSPIEAAATDLGARQVEEILASIRYGLPV